MDDHHSTDHPIFSILLPTWNNLEYLKLCVRSIQQHSTYQHQIILHINDGSDGTLEWAKAQQLDHTHSPENIGICKAVNLSFALAKSDYICYMNDDMYVCPGWDRLLMDEINTYNLDKFMISSTMIEPVDTGNPSVIVGNYGTDVAQFREKDLLEQFGHLSKEDWSGSLWPPFVMHRKQWIAVGGFSEAFSPGMYSDPDLAMKLWQDGCRLFKGLGKSKVYHFMAKSTGKIKKNPGKKQFLDKWGIKASTFVKYYLRRGAPFDGFLQEPDPSAKFQIKKWGDRISKFMN